jgi:hypothetical protein
VKFTTTQKRQAAEREVTLRIRVFAKKVGNGLMTREKADYEIDIMRAIAFDYEMLEEMERLL